MKMIPVLVLLSELLMLLSLTNCATAQKADRDGLFTPKLSFKVNADKRDGSTPCSSVVVHHETKEVTADNERAQLKKALHAAGFKEAANGDCDIALSFERLSPATGSVTVGFLVGYTHTAIVTASRKGSPVWTTKASVMIEDDNRKSAVGPLLSVAKDFFGKDATKTVSRSLNSVDEEDATTTK